MTYEFGRLLADGQLLGALRALFKGESEEAVIEFLRAAGDEVRLKDVCLLLALDLAEQNPSDQALSLLEKMLRRDGNPKDAKLVRTRMTKLSSAFDDAIETVVSGRSLSDEVRRSVVAELLVANTLSPAEIVARKDLLRDLKGRCIVASPKRRPRSS